LRWQNRGLARVQKELANLCQLLYIYA
jgi:hypothetical protein